MSQPYAHEWVITVKADDLQGAMDAVWNCWEAWSRGSEPVGGATPASLGARMSYDVKKKSELAPEQPRT